MAERNNIAGKTSQWRYTSTAPASKKGKWWANKKSHVNQPNGLGCCTNYKKLGAGKKPNARPSNFLISGTSHSVAPPTMAPPAAMAPPGKIGAAKENRCQHAALTPTPTWSHALSQFSLYCFSAPHLCQCSGLCTLPPTHSHIGRIRRRQLAPGSGSAR